MKRIRNTGFKNDDNNNLQIQRCPKCHTDNITLMFRWRQVQQPAVHQEVDAAAEGQVQVGLRRPQARKLQVKIFEELIIYFFFF